MPQSGSSNHVRPLPCAPLRPLSSPSIASAGRGSRRAPPASHAPFRGRHWSQNRPRPCPGVAAASRHTDAPRRACIRHRNRDVTVLHAAARSWYHRCTRRAPLPRLVQRCRYRALSAWEPHHGCPGYGALSLDMRRMRVVWLSASLRRQQPTGLLRSARDQSIGCLGQRQWFFHGSLHGVTRCPDGDILLGRMSRALSPQTASRTGSGGQ